MKATIQLSIAYTYKDEWSKGKFQNVNSFIPSCGIGEGTQHKLAVLLLMDEVVDLFINKKNSQHCLYHGKPYGAIFNVALVMSFNPSFEHLLIFYGCPVVSSVGYQANQDSSCKIFSFVVLVAILMKTWCHWSHNERTKSYWPQGCVLFSQWFHPNCHVIQIPLGLSVYHAGFTVCLCTLPIVLPIVLVSFDFLCFKYNVWKVHGKCVKASESLVSLCCTEQTYQFTGTAVPCIMCTVGRWPFVIFKQMPFCLTPLWSQTK